MLRIRFFRIGKKNQPFFRIVVTDKKNPPRGGRFLEIVGFFNPFTKEKKLKKERIKHWLSVGAQPSDRVHNLLVDDGIVKGKKVSVNAKEKKSEEKGGTQEKPKEVKSKEGQKEELKEKVEEKKKAESKEDLQQELQKSKEEIEEEVGKEIKEVVEKEEQKREKKKPEEQKPKE